MSLGPTATSVIQPYGQPCAFSTEQQVLAKTPRKVAPVALEVNSEGVIQNDGLSTRGILMMGGPSTELRNVWTPPVPSHADPITADQLVNGIIIIPNATGPYQITLPTVTALNSFVNSRLVTAANAIDMVNANTAPRTCFRLTIFASVTVTIRTAGPGVPPGHAQSGFWISTQAVAPAARAITQLAPGASNTVIGPALAAIGAAIDVYFIQVPGTGTDPEWMMIGTSI